MSKTLTIVDKDYTQWVDDLSMRYRQSQVRAAVKVNSEMIKYYWSLGRDIEEMHVEERWGESVIKNLATDLQHKNPNATGLSRTNIYYAKKFYLLYSKALNFVPQPVGQIGSEVVSQPTAQSENGDTTQAQVAEKVPQTVGQSGDINFSQLLERFYAELFSIPWGHHRFIIDKCSSDARKALFYVRKTVENGWSRDVLLNIIGTDLYERSGKALTNFTRTLPEATSELAQELAKDPYNFAFTGIRERYNERKLKDALLSNISQFLLELGTGFAYVGKEYRLQIGQKEKFVDLLFYNLKLSCYVVIEVKIGEFDFQDLGQLSGYVVACNHLLKKEGRDNPTIGLLICRQKDSLLAQYALEGSNLPLGISEYELSKLYPEKVEGTIPTIDEIEAKLDGLQL